MWMQKFIGFYKSLAITEPIEGRKILCIKLSTALRNAFGREEEGSVLGDIEARLTKNLCECILYFYGEICGIPENVPIFLKNAFHIPEEHQLELASLHYITLSAGTCNVMMTSVTKMQVFIEINQL